MKKSKSFRQKSQKGNSVSKDLNPHRLPQLTDQLQTGFTFRYITTGIGSSASTTITFQNLLDSWCVATSATSAKQLFDFIKIKRVTVRAVSNPGFAGGTTGLAFLGTSATVGIEFPGLVAGTNAGGKQAVNTAMGTSDVAMVSLCPDRMSAAAFWQGSSGNVAFVVRCVDWQGNPIVGAVIDVHVSLKNSADVQPAAVASALSGAVAGEYYFRGIDGAAVAATWARSDFVPRI
jgi:hypothetical protein